LANRALPINLGSYTVTGQNPGLLVNRQIPLDAGSYTVTGQDAALLANRHYSLIAYCLLMLAATLSPGKM
jgi:hypothetical protein